MSLVVPLEEIFANKTRLLANHESWERVALGEVCTILNGFPFKSTLFNKSEGFPVIRIRDITRSSTETFCSGDVPPEYVVKKGDLLIGMDGNFRCCEWQGRDAGLNQRVCKITPDERVLNRKFLLFGLNGYLNAIEDVTSSVTVGHLSSRDVQRIPFPLPPLAEQRRIVAKLETLLGKVDASQQRLAKIPVLLKRFRQSVLTAACSGRLTADWREENPNVESAQSLYDQIQAERLRLLGAKKKSKQDSVTLSSESEQEIQNDIPDTWMWTRLGSIALLVTDGVHKTPRYQQEGVPFISVNNVSDEGGLSFEGCKFISDEEHQIFTQRCKPEAGDILFGKVGTLGRTCVIPPKRAFSIFVNVALIKLMRNLTQSGFIACALRSGYLNGDFDYAIGGTAQQYIGIGAISDLKVRLAPLPEQQEIVRRVEGLFALADQLEARLAKARGQVDKLTPSLLARAFAGKLVPQDPNDEPAEKLVERIKSKGKSRAAR